MAIAFEYALTKRIRHGLRGQQRSKSNIFPVVWEYDIANPGSAPVIQQLPIPSGFFSATTTAVNDAGDVVGYAGSPNIDSHDKIENVEEAFVLSRRARAIIRQNITISLGVIFFLIVSALAEKINLTTGVIGHEGSTVVVILNGLRLLRAHRNHPPS